MEINKMNNSPRLVVPLSRRQYAKLIKQYNETDYAKLEHSVKSHKLALKASEDLIEALEQAQSINLNIHASMFKKMKQMRRQIKLLLTLCAILTSTVVVMGAYHA
jgi:hypothetical protein